MTGVGIDFGTSNSALACYDGRELRLVRLEPDGVVMPTATHLDREFEVTTGQAAVELYIEENRNRLVELTPEVIGRSSLLVADADLEDPDSRHETHEEVIYGRPLTDRGMPGRLFRGVKRLLGQESIRRLLVFDRPFRLVALITPVLGHIRERAEAEIGRPLGRCHLGRPIHFEGRDEYRNQLALDRLAESCRHAGYARVEFYPEPLAAMLSYFHGRPHGDRGVVLTFDFGGGTLDLSLVRYRQEQFEVLATAGLAEGGDHIDQLIFRRFLFPELGKGARWRRVVDGQVIDSLFPFEEYEEALLNWPVTYTLNQGRFRARIADCIAQGGASAAAFQRLEELICRNHSYVVFQSIQAAKARLSSVESTFIDIPELDLLIPFNREELNALLQPMMEQIRQLLTQTLGRAGIEPAEVDLVIRTGGSSLLHAVHSLLEASFPGRVTAHDPFTSVAAGLAIASYHGFSYRPDEPRKAAEPEPARR